MAHNYRILRLRRNRAPPHREYITKELHPTAPRVCYEGIAPHHAENLLGRNHARRTVRIKSRLELSPWSTCLLARRYRILIIFFLSLWWNVSKDIHRCAVILLLSPFIGLVLSYNLSEDYVTLLANLHLTAKPQSHLYSGTRRPQRTWITRNHQ